MVNTKRVDPAVVLAEFFDSMNAEDEAPMTRIDAIARRHGVSRQAVLHHLQADERWTPRLRDDVETDSQGIWRMKPIGGPLAEAISEIGQRRRDGLGEAERATAELLPLLARARREGTPEYMSFGQLEVLTGISRGHIGKLVEDYLASQPAKRGNGARTSRRRASR